MSEQVQCGKCGALLAYESGKQSLKCTYCGQVTEIAKPETALPDAVEFILPLTVDKAAVDRAIRHHIAADDDAPDGMLGSTQITKFERLYVPAHLFQGDFTATWTVSFGYDRQETFTVMESRYVDGAFRQVPVSKTRTVTDWRPVNGEATGSFAFPVYAGELLSSPGLVALAERQDMDAATEFNGSFAAGLEVEAFSQPSKAAFDARGASVLASIIEAEVLEHAQGDRQKDWRWNPKVRTSSASILLPVCHAVFEYEGKTYNFWTAGTDVSRSRMDSLPRGSRASHANRSGWWVVGAALAGAVIGAMVVGPNFFLLGLVPALIFAIVAQNAGSTNDKLVLQHSRQVRQNTLARMEAESASGQPMSDADQQRAASSFADVAPPKLKDVQKYRRLVPYAAAIAFALGFIPNWTVDRAAAVEPVADVAASAATPDPGPVVEPEPVAVDPAAALVGEEQPLAEPVLEETAVDVAEQVAEVEPEPAQLDEGQVLERVRADFVAARQCLRRRDGPCAEAMYVDVLSLAPSNVAASRALGCVRSTNTRDIATCDPDRQAGVPPAPMQQVAPEQPYEDSAQQVMEPQDSSPAYSSQANASSNSPDAEYERRRGECPGGFLGKACRHKIREEVCVGQWSRDPPPGASNCKR